MIIYVFRHGQTLESKADISYSQDRKITADILPETVPVIEKLSEYLKGIHTDKNLTSPIKRCLQTVEIVKKISGKEFEINENLKEWMDPTESFEDLVNRVKLVYDQILNTDFESIAICTHGGVIAGLKSVFETGGFKIERLSDYPNPGVILVLDTQKNTTTQLDFNS